MSERTRERINLNRPSSKMPNTNQFNAILRFSIVSGLYLFQNSVRQWEAVAVLRLTAGLAS